MIGLDAAKLPSHLGCYSSLESWPQRINCPEKGTETLGAIFFAAYPTAIPSSCRTSCFQKMRCLFTANWLAPVDPGIRARDSQPTAPDEKNPELTTYCFWVSWIILTD